MAEEETSLSIMGLAPPVCDSHSVLCPALDAEKAKIPWLLVPSCLVELTEGE